MQPSLRYKAQQPMSINHTKDTALQDQIYMDPSPEEFWLLVRFYNENYLKSRGWDWQVRGIYFEGHWYIWSAVHMTHQMAAIKMKLLQAHANGSTTQTFSFGHVDEEGDALGPHIQMCQHVKYTELSPPRPYPFLQGLDRKGLAVYY